MPLPARDRKIKKRTGFGSHPERLFVGCLKRRSSDCYDRKIKKRTGFGSHPERTKPNLSTIFPGGMSGVLNFQFRSGETLPELRLHYRTLSKPAYNASGGVTNAVLI